MVEVEIRISQLVEDLRQGMSWYAADDKGCGSIQAKYGADDDQIADIKAHPVFQTLKIFRIVDDYSKPVVRQTAPQAEPVRATTAEPASLDDAEAAFSML